MKLNNKLFFISFLKEKVKKAQIEIKAYMVSLLQGLDQKSDEIETLRVCLVEMPSFHFVTFLGSRTS